MARTGIIALLACASMYAQVVDLTRSPYAKLHPVPVKAVQLKGGFWEPRRKVNVEKSLPTMLQLIEQQGRVDNFLRLEGKTQAPRKGPVYTDSDVYKWMEAAAFALQSEDRPELRADLDRLTDIIVAAQEPSGYLNTYYQDDRAKLRFTEMYKSHELYCLGHMLQAAIAPAGCRDQVRQLPGLGLRAGQAPAADRAPGIRDGGDRVVPGYGQ